MNSNPEIPRRRSLRLQDYDYSQAGAYFVTLCTQDVKCLFGNIEDGEMLLNEVGRVVEMCWKDIPNHFSHVKLDEFVIMPNHVHGILFIGDTPIGRAKKFFAPTGSQIISKIQVETTIRDIENPWLRHPWFQNRRYQMDAAKHNNSGRMATQLLGAHRPP